MTRQPPGDAARRPSDGTSTPRPGLQPHQLVRRTIALVLAGGRGSRLKQLTDRRAKPAVYFGGKFRIIDFALSNCLNSGIRRIGVVTQYKSHSLLRHLQRGWSFLRAELNEMVDLLPAQQRLDEEHWYRGTADAVYQNLDIIQARRAPSTSSCWPATTSTRWTTRSCCADHVEQRRRLHRRLHRGAAHGGHRVRRDGDRRAAPDHRLRREAGRPAADARQARQSRWPAWASTCSTPTTCTALLEEDIANPASSHDFGKDIIPRAVAEGRALAHPFSHVAASANPQRHASRTGATSARSMRSGPPTSTWRRSIPSSTSTTRDWPIWTYQRSCRRPSSSSTPTASTALPSTPWSRAAASCRGATGDATRCCSPACACTPFCQRRPGRAAARRGRSARGCRLTQAW